MAQAPRVHRDSIVDRRPTCPFSDRVVQPKRVDGQPSSIAEGRDKRRIRARAPAEDLLAVLVSTHPSGYRDALGSGGLAEKLRIGRVFLLVTAAAWFLAAALFGAATMGAAAFGAPTLAAAVLNDPLPAIILVVAVIDWYLLFWRGLRGPAGKPHAVFHDALVQTMSRLVRPARGAEVELTLDARSWAVSAPLARGAFLVVNAHVDGGYLCVTMRASSPESQPWDGQHWPGITPPEVRTSPGPPATIEIGGLDLPLHTPASKTSQEAPVVLAGLVAEIAARAVGERRVASLLSARRAQRAGRFVADVGPAPEPASAPGRADRQRSQPWAVAAPELTRARNARARRLRATWTMAVTLSVALLLFVSWWFPVAGAASDSGQTALAFVLAAGLACVALLTPYLVRTRARIRVRVSNTDTAPLALRDRAIYAQTPTQGIDLERPFQLDLTRDPDEVAGASLLGVVVSQSASTGALRRVRFCVPMRAEDLEGLPALTLDAPIMEAAPFAEWLWPALRYHAALHGNPVDRHARGPG